MHQLFEMVYLKTVRIDFDDIFQKTLVVCVFQFSCRYAFIFTFRLSNWQTFQTFHLSPIKVRHDTDWSQHQTT